MKRLSWKYIAGFIDGEGCIDVQISKGNYVTPRLRVALAEPGKEVLEHLQANFGGSLLKRESTNSNWSTAYSWEITGYAKVASLLRNIVNHLVIKKEQARLILWCESNLKGRHLNEDVRKCAIQELKAMKRDPHRLSERAQDNILGCDSRAS